MTEDPWPKSPWLAVTPTVALSTWRPVAWPLSCQVSSQTWAMAWAGMASPKEGQLAGGVDGDAAADGGGPGAQQLFGFALGAQAEVFIPVEFQCGGQVVDLGQGEVFGADTGFGVGGASRIWSLKTRSGPGTTAVESVAISGSSGRCWGYWGIAG